MNLLLNLQGERNMSLTDKFDIKKDRRTIDDISEKIFPKTYLDGSFQRWGGVYFGSGWSLKSGVRFLENFFSGKTFNFIMNIDVKHALRHCEEIGCTKSVEYYKEVLEKGFDYVSIDGNNTSSFLAEYVKPKNPDESPLKVKLPQDLDTSTKPPKKAVEFSKLPEDIKKQILYCEKQEVILLRNITIDEATELFRALNTSTKLNDQEKRQAKLTALAEFVRECGENSKDFFLDFHLKGKGEVDIHKRKHEEMIARILLQLDSKYTSDVVATDLDDFYEKDDVSSDTKKKMKNILDTFVKVQENVEEFSNNDKISRGQLIAFANIIDFIDDSGYKISNHRAFFEWFLKTQNEFDQISGTIPGDEAEEKSYAHWTKYYYRVKNYMNAKHLWMSEIYNNRESLIEEGVISIKRTSKDVFSADQKRELFYEQCGITRSGINISILDLYAKGSKYEVDHVNPVSKGGKTTISNGEIMTKEDNRKKGSEKNSPYFDFQQQEILEVE